jgi:hypothetical protein
MRFLYRGSLVSLLAISLAWPAIAQNGSPPDQPTSGSATSPRTLTGKERLGRKWMDEQRIDNCNVPTDKRGNRPRPDNCMNSPSG